MSDSGSYDIISDGSSGDSFVYLDADGNVIVMDSESDGEVGVDSPRLEMKEYAEDPVEFERERLLARERLEATMGQLVISPSPAGAVAVEGRSAVAVVNGADTAIIATEEPVVVERAAVIGETAIETPSITNDNVEGDEDAAGDEVDEEAAEEWCPPEDEWILERILDRRAVKGGEGGSDYKEFYDDFGEKKTGMMAAGRVEYLCKWKGYDEPTWEGKEMLEDDYFMELQTYKKEVIKAEKKEAADRLASAAYRERMMKEAPKESEPYQVPKRLTVPRNKSADNDNNDEEPFFGNDADIASIVGIFPRDIAERFALSGAKMVGYGCCASQARIDEFLRKYQALADTHRPAIVFHSCKPCQLERVALFGPRSGLSVRSMPKGRSELGMPSTQQIAMCGKEIFRSMFVCVGLISNSTANSGWIDAEGSLVFTDNSNLLPLWLVDFLVHTDQLVRPTPLRHYLSPMTIRYRMHTMWSYFDENRIQEVTFRERKMKKAAQRKVSRINRMAERNPDH